MTINILWIKPQDTQLKLIPGAGSPLENIARDGLVLSDDNQMNYPFTTTLTVLRQLQSALEDRKIHGSIMNLSAVPRKAFAEGSWTESYLGDVYKTIPYGKSVIECRRIGRDIADVEGLDDIIAAQDLVVVPTPFETQVNEVARTAAYLKGRFGDSVRIMTSGTGVEGQEEYLLQNGLDLVFIGEVSDRGEDVLEALVAGDYERLAGIDGVYTDLGSRVRNLGARNYRRDRESQARNITEWNRRINRYLDFADISFDMVGRPDLVDPGRSVHPILQHCNSFSDLDYQTLRAVLPEGDEMYLAADEIAVQRGCQENCDFCHATGKGVARVSDDYTQKLIEFYRGLGATAFIPTSDQLLFMPAQGENSARAFRRILETLKSNGMSVLPGNGMEFDKLSVIIDKASRGSEAHQQLLDVLFDISPYLYLPFENLEALTGNAKGTGLRKLSGGLHAYRRVMEYADRYAREKGRTIELSTNIILKPEDGRDDVAAFYAYMDDFFGNYSNLNASYYAFNIIPSNCASHVLRLRRDYVLYSEQYLELKAITVPQVIPHGRTPEHLEDVLAWNRPLIEALSA